MIIKDKALKKDVIKISEIIDYFCSENLSYGITDFNKFKDSLSLLFNTFTTPSLSDYKLEVTKRSCNCYENTHKIIVQLKRKIKILWFFNHNLYIYNKTFNIK